MRGYSEQEIFSKYEVHVLDQVSRMLAELPDIPDVRCHELTRAVGRAFRLEHQDGFYGFVDHSWLWTTPLSEARQALRKTRIGFPNILDVYSVGQLPMVRLVACESSSLPHVGWAYRPGDAREDIDLKMVETIYRALMDGPRPQRST